MNMSTFDNGQPEKFLAQIRNFKIAIDRTGTTTSTVQINYLRTIIHGKIPRGFDELSLQGNTTNKQIKHIPGVYFITPPPPLNALYKNNIAMRRAIRKPHYMHLKHFAERLKEINNFLPLFPRSDASKRLRPEELD